MKQITCQRCNKQFNSCIILDGKKRNLNNRKFCLECSPFGLNNRFDLRYDKFKYVNLPNTDEFKSEHAEVVKKRQSGKVNYTYQQKRYAERKQKLVDHHGGGCKNCGYNRCLKALEFHHRNPEDKKFNINVVSIRSKSYDKVLEESLKCDLLCANCHRQLHDEVVDKTNPG